MHNASPNIFNLLQKAIFKPGREITHGFYSEMGEKREQNVGIKFYWYRMSRSAQGGFDGRGQPTASPMLTAIMSGGVGISGRELYKYGYMGSLYIICQHNSSTP